ncbi:MAG TPA: hypothetical protein VKS22_13270 [Candidatus Binataceae bacterium]|nr:hypothetical protein [Candidatus Binataceae bacterium]
MIKAIRNLTLAAAACLLSLSAPVLAANQTLTFKAPPNALGTTMQLQNNGVVTVGANGLVTIQVANPIGGACAAGTQCDYTGKDIMRLLAAGFQMLTGEPFSISWDGALGGLGNAAVKPFAAPCAGTFSKLICTAILTGACTTGPTINVGDITATTTGTAVSPTTAVATLASANETLVFAYNDTIALEQTATTSSCTAPSYSCSANLVCS